MKIIDYDVIEKNIKKILKTNEISIVLKNDAYGFKMDKIIKIAINNGIKTFFVNNIKEGVKARMLTDANIVLLGPSKQHLLELIKYKITPTAINLEDLIFYINNKIKFALEIDVGMNRFGIKEFDEIIDNKYIDLVYAHFYKVLDSNKKIMDDIADLCKKNNKSFCFGGSMIYGLNNYPLRLGRMLYENSVSFFGKVIEIKKVKKGDYIGYESEYRAQEDIIIGILDVGYYNGLKMNFKGRVFLNSKYFQVIGRVCMNHTFVLIDSSVKINDYLEFFGSNILIDEFLINNSMSKYESFLLIK